MKKIITAAAVAAMAASFAAAEVTVGLNARVRPNLYSITGTTEKGDTDAYTSTTYADLDGFGAMSDTLSIKGKTDYAGIQADLTLTSGIGKDGNEIAELEAGKAGETAFKIDNYYAWLNWGSFKITGGVYDSRYTNRGNYTATEQGILDEEFSKTMGLSTKNGLSVKGAKFLGDFGNVAQVNGGNYLSLLADYTLNDIAGGNLLLKGGLVENAGDEKYKNTNISTESYDSYTDKDGNSFSQSAGYVFEAAWRKDDTVAVDFIFKNPCNKAYGFGLYVTPLMIQNTKNVVLGFTYGTREDSIKSAFAIDLRGQYNIDSQMTVALGAKYESYEADVSGADAETAMQVAGEFSYKVNDIVTAALDLGYFNQDMDNNDDVDDDGSQFFVTSLRGKFTAGKNAAITTALRLKKVLNPADGGTDYTFDIPVVLRVKM